jgi:hypothetical protein
MDASRDDARWGMLTAWPFVMTVNFGNAPAVRFGVARRWLT